MISIHGDGAQLRATLQTPRGARATHSLLTGTAARLFLFYQDNQDNYFCLRDGSEYQNRCFFGKVTREGGNFQSKNLDSSVLVPFAPAPPLTRIGKRPNWPRKACEIKLSLDSLVCFETRLRVNCAKVANWSLGNMVCSGGQEGRLGGRLGDLRGQRGCLGDIAY